MENQISNEQLTIAPSVRETAAEDGAVLLDTEHGICFSLNPVGLRIWEMLKKEHSVDEIADAFERDFHVPRAELVLDISDFLRELEAKQLIRRPNLTSPRRPWLTRILPWRKERASVA